MKKLICFDLETTGTNRDIDRVIQFSGIKYDPNTNKILGTKNLYIKPEGNYTIAIQAWFKHKITPEFLSDKPYFKDVADEIVDFFGSPDEYDILTYNGNSFDIPFLIKELNRVEKHIDFLSRQTYDAFLEEKRRNGINLENTFTRYYNTTMEDKGLSVHDALSDVKATIGVFKAQQKAKKYGPDNLICEDNFLAILPFNGENKICFNYGKYAGLAVDWINTFDTNYINWCLMDSTGFSKSTKEVITNIVKN